jgi:3-phenylpropionate/trans-cinnamate dioxygenase ferredoxin subunit
MTAQQDVTRNWIRACGASEVTPDLPKAVVVGETPVALVLHAGEYYAIHDVCSHANVALSEGEVVDCEIECWLHGSMFDLKTGKPSSLPATEPVPVYPVKIEGDDLYVAVKEA